jgi:hypothetical protein
MTTSNIFMNKNSAVLVDINQSATRDILWSNFCKFIGFFKYSFSFIFTCFNITKWLPEMCLVSLEMLTVAQLAKKLHLFMAPEYSLLCSQQIFVLSQLDPFESPHIRFLARLILMLSFHSYLGLLSSLFFWISSLTNQCIYFPRHSHLTWFSYANNLILGKQQSTNYVIFQVLTAATIAVTVFWNIAPCSLVEVDRHFRSAYFHHHQGGERNRVSLLSCFLDIQVF